MGGEGAGLGRELLLPIGFRFVLAELHCSQCSVVVSFLTEESMQFLQCAVS